VERRLTEDAPERTFEAVAQHYLTGLERKVLLKKRSPGTLRKARWALRDYIVASGIVEAGQTVKIVGVDLLLARLFVNAERKILPPLFVLLNTLRRADFLRSVPGLLSLIEPILARAGADCRSVVTCVGYDSGNALLS
jgi:hypothetical protein